MADEQILDNITLPTAKQGTDVGFALTDLPKPIFGHVTFAEKGNEMAFNGQIRTNKFDAFSEQMKNVYGKDVYIVWHHDSPSDKPQPHKTKKK